MNNREARKMARECAMQLLYEMESHHEFTRERKERFWERLPYLRKQDDESADAAASAKLPDKAYFDTVVDLVADHLATLDEVLAQASENWKLDRIGRVDLSILRLAAAEICYMEDIPSSVSVNEAVELAKKFSGEDSGKFVNGILGNVARNRDVTPS